MSTLHKQAVASMSRPEHLRTEVFRHYVEWRDELRRRITSGNRLPLMQKPDQKREEAAVNRQLALAIFSDLEYNYRLDKKGIEEYTGKSQVHWNFQILGTTEVSDDELRKYRTEQKTSDYFVASMLNQLNALGVSIEWELLGKILMQGRWRVIAEPADKDKRSKWRSELAHGAIPSGIDYPAPWHVANWAGEMMEAEALRVYLGYPATADVVTPGRIRRLDIACFEDTDKDDRPERPSILKGLGDRSIKREDAVGSDLEEWIQKNLRRMHPMLEQERERRFELEAKLRETEQKLQDTLEQLKDVTHDFELELERRQKLQRRLEGIHMLTQFSNKPKAELKAKGRIINSDEDEKEG